MVTSNAGRSRFVEILLCSDCYRNVDGYFLFGLFLDSVRCIIFWSPRDHVDSFLRHWGWRAGRLWLGFSSSFIRRAFSLSIRLWGRWLFFFFFGILNGLFVFVLTAKCRSTFLSRMTFPIVECTVFAGVICRRFVLWRIVYSIEVLPFSCWFFRGNVLFGSVIFVRAVLLLQGCNLLFVGSEI